MQNYINIYKMKKNIRYTFLDKNGVEFRGKFNKYILMNGINNIALDISNINNFDENLHIQIPINFISKVSIYTIPNNTLQYFQYKLPEINLIINQYI